MALTKEEIKWATILALTEPPQRSKPGEAPGPEPPVSTPYLTFHSDDGEFTIRTSRGAKAWIGTLEYSIDTETWAEWDGVTELESNNGYLYMRGSGNTGFGSSNYNQRWVLSGTNVACTGNIENLLDYSTVSQGNHPTMRTYCYAHLFYGCTSLITAPDLPATELTNYCYYYMFYGCTNLKTAPSILPAATLTNYCYTYMFYDCNSLEAAPELPATELAGACYYGMFERCRSLVTAPDLPATALTSSCYYSMFARCSSLEVAPELPATTLTAYCYNMMFYYCTKLALPPRLQATILAERCYYSMFSGCTSLITAPELPATTLARECYMNIFSSCRSLKFSKTSNATYKYAYRIPTTGDGIDAYQALASMFSDTGGTFSTTPTINTTYYTDHEPV